MNFKRISSLNKFVTHITIVTGRGNMHRLYMVPARGLISTMFATYSAGVRGPFSLLEIVL